MSAFSCYNILKSQAKILSRGRDTKLADALEMVAVSAKFSSFHELSKVAKTAPMEARLMSAALGVADLRKAIHEDEVPMELEEELEDLLAGAVAETNASEFSVYDLVANAAKYDDARGMLTLGVSLSYRGKQHQDRVYFGSAFYLDCTAYLLRRDGVWKLAEDEGLLINHGESDRDRDREAEFDYLESERQREFANRPLISLAEALADEFEIGVDEAEQLVDAEITSNESDDGHPYGYWIDVEPVASETLKRKLRNRFGSLQIQLGINFFDQIDSNLD